MVNNMRYDDYLQEQLKNPDVKKEWDDLQPEMDVIRAMIDARIKNNLTQRSLQHVQALIRRILVSLRMEREIHL